MGAAASVVDGDNQSKATTTGAQDSELATLASGKEEVVVHNLLPYFSRDREKFERIFAEVCFQANATVPLFPPDLRIDAIPCISDEEKRDFVERFTSTQYLSHDSEEGKSRSGNESCSG